MRGGSTAGDLERKEEGGKPAKEKMDRKNQRGQGWMLVAGDGSVCTAARPP